MNKLTVQFTHQNAKKYSFITHDETIKLGDLVCVTSPVSKKGFALARVFGIQYDTKDCEHLEIVSKVNTDEVQKIYEVEKYESSIENSYDVYRIKLYLTQDNILHCYSRYNGYLVKQLSDVLDLEFNDSILIYDEWTRKHYKLTKSANPGINYYVVDLLHLKIYINIEEVDLTDINYTIILEQFGLKSHRDDFRVKIDYEKRQQLKNNLKNLYEYKNPDYENPFDISEDIVKDILNLDETFMLFEKYDYEYYAKLSVEEGYIQNLKKEIKLTLDELLNKFDFLDDFEKSKIDCTTGVRRNRNETNYFRFLEDPFELLYLEKTNLDLQNNVPLEGTLYSLGEMSFLYSRHTHGKPIHYDTDFDKDLDENIKLRINVE